MGFLLELLVGLLFELVLQVVTEVLLALGISSIEHSMRRSRAANPVLAATGLVIVGAAIGVLTCWLLPGPLVKPTRYTPWPGLLVAPIGTGAVMHALGAWRRRNGGDPSVLATFWGGALFAFAMEAARVLCVRGGPHV